MSGIRRLFVRKTPLYFDDFHFLHHFAALERVYMLHAFDDFAEHRMLAVQVRLRLVANIKLAASRIAAGMGKRKSKCRTARKS